MQTLCQESRYAGLTPPRSFLSIETYLCLFDESVALRKILAADLTGSVIPRLFQSRPLRSLHQNRNYSKVRIGPLDGVQYLGHSRGRIPDRANRD